METHEIELTVKVECLMAPNWTRGHLAMTIAGCTFTDPETDELIGYLESNVGGGNPIIKIKTGYGEEGNSMEVWSISPRNLFTAFVEARGDLDIPPPQPKEPSNE